MDEFARWHTRTTSIFRDWSRRNLGCAGSSRGCFRTHRYRPVSDMLWAGHRPDALQRQQKQDWQTPALYHFRLWLLWQVTHRVDRFTVALDGKVQVDAC